MSLVIQRKKQGVTAETEAVTNKTEIKYPKEDIVNKACDKQEEGVTAKEKANVAVEDEAVDQEAEKRSQQRMLSTRWSLKKTR